MGHSTIWVTLWKIGYISKNGSHSKSRSSWKIGPILKSGSHCENKSQLEKCVTFETIGRTVKNGSHMKKWFLILKRSTVKYGTRFKKCVTLWKIDHTKMGDTENFGHLVKNASHVHFEKLVIFGKITLSGTGPGFSLFMNRSWASYLILHANSPKIINRRIYLLGQQINSTVHCVGKICWNPLRILVIRLLPRLAIASDYWTTTQCGFWSDNID